MVTNPLMFVRRVLYSLKRQYGFSLDIYRRTAGEADLKTGKMVGKKRQKFSIVKAIVLPTILARKFSYDLSYIAANKNFTYGGFYDINSRIVIIDAIDLPQDFEFIIDTDYVVYDSKRYDIKTAEMLEQRQGFLLNIKATEGSTAFEILDEKVLSTFGLSQAVIGVK